MRKALGISAVLALTALVACGPSFQAVYEGNVHFEHCYALEENAQATMPDKSSCWRDWSEHYTFGQTRDRVQYAVARYVALSRMDAAPTDEAMMMAAPGETPRRSNINAPAPTNAFAPPPKVLETSDPRPVRTGDPASVPVLPIDAGAPVMAVGVSMPASSCADTCGGDYRACAGACDGDAGAKSKACATCQQKYRGCMRGCFK